MTTTQGNPDAGDGAVKTTEEARQGQTTGHMRWVLRISLVLGVLAMGGAYVGYTAMQHPASPPQAAAPHEPAAS